MKGELTLEWELSFILLLFHYLFDLLFVNVYVHGEVSLKFKHFSVIRILAARRSL